MVTPIPHPQVKKLKEEPDENRDKSSEQKILCGFRERRVISCPEIHAVYNQDEGPPGKTVKPRLHKGKSEHKKNCGNNEKNKTQKKVEADNFFLHLQIK
jgi:hypothetical protein